MSRLVCARFPLTSCRAILNVRRMTNPNDETNIGNVFLAIQQATIQIETLFENIHNLSGQALATIRGPRGMSALTQTTTGRAATSRSQSRRFKGTTSHAVASPSAQKILTYLRSRPESNQQDVIRAVGGRGATSRVFDNLVASGQIVRQGTGYVVSMIQPPNGTTQQMANA